MAVKELGVIVVTTAGTPVRATANEDDPTARVPVHSITFEVLPGNTDRVYIGNAQTMTPASVTTPTQEKGGILIHLSPPTANAAASWTVGNTEQPNGLNAADFWVDVAADGEGVLITAVVS